MNNSITPSTDAKLDELVSKLDKHKMPSKDLWIGIEHALVAQQSLEVKRSMRPLYALAVSICVVAFVAVFSFQSGKSLSGEALVQQLSEQHLAVKKSLLVSLENQPAVTQNWQQQLEELDAAAIAIKKALENEPNNTALLIMLKKVYEQQIALIERVHAPAWQQI